MAMETIKPEIIQKETIKPSSPTPPHHKSVRLSLLDQFVPITYTTLILFYPGNDQDVDTDLDHDSRILEKFLTLKSSLSETLTWFYPFAGRLKDNNIVVCDDQGAEFIAARVSCPLSEILQNPEAEFLNQLLPAAMESPEAATGSLLLVQATSFGCGGLAVGICISHKMADAATLSTFIKCWSAVSTASSMAVNPLFMGASVFPPIDMSIPRTPVELMQQKCVTRRYVFTASKISALRATAASSVVPDPTRIEAVSGILWKTVMIASRSRFGKFRPSIWSLSVNMRPRFQPPLPENYAGNCLGHVSSKIMDENSALELKELVGRIRKEKEGFGENYIKKLEGEGALLAICGFTQEFGNWAMSNELDFYICTSWCKFGLYEADFGWGNPVWLSSCGTRVRNVAILMDTRDGDGVEAWVTLPGEVMALFESNQQLLQFASVNPSVS